MLGLSRSVSKQINSGLVQLSRSNSSAAKGFAADRATYQSQLKNMRSTWFVEANEQRELKNKQLKEEQRIRVENRAIKMREKAELSAIMQAQHSKWMESDQLRKRAYQAKQFLAYDDRTARQVERFRRVAEDLQQESQAWITRENMKEKITASLFDEEASTGLRTKYSDRWRYRVESYEYQTIQSFHPEQLVVDKYDNPEEAYEQSVAQRRFRHRENVEEFLSCMVNSGEDLVRLKELTDVVVESNDDWKLMHEYEDSRDELNDFEMRMEGGQRNFNPTNEQVARMEMLEKWHPVDDEVMKRDGMEAGSDSDVSSEDESDADDYSDDERAMASGSSRDSLSATDLELHELLESQSQYDDEDGSDIDTDWDESDLEEIETIDYMLDNGLLKPNKNDDVPEDDEDKLTRKFIRGTSLNAFAGVMAEKLDKLHDLALAKGQDSFVYAGDKYMILPGQQGLPSSGYVTVADYERLQAQAAVRREARLAARVKRMEATIDAELEDLYTAALAAGEDTFTYRGYAHVFSAQEKEDYAQRVKDTEASK